VVADPALLVPKAYQELESRKKDPVCLTHMWPVYSQAGHTGLHHCTSRIGDAWDSRTSSLFFFFQMCRCLDPLCQVFSCACCDVQVTLPNELTVEELSVLLSTKAICAWGECYHRRG
jgi:hypothetical protein